MLDYLALVDPETFAEVGDAHVGPVLVLVAGLVEGTRLIDNATVACGTSPEGGDGRVNG